MCAGVGVVLLGAKCCFKQTSGIHYDLCVDSVVVGLKRDTVYFSISYSWVFVLWVLFFLLKSGLRKDRFRMASAKAEWPRQSQRGFGKVRVASERSGCPRQSQSALGKVRAASA